MKMIKSTKSAKIKESETIAIIIGFKYDNKELIPSTIIDLFLISHHCEKQEIPSIILTDIKDAKLPRGFLDIVVSGEIDEKVTEFLGDSDNNAIEIKDKSDLISAIISNIKHKKRILIYYSGHGEFDSIRLPSGDYME